MDTDKWRSDFGWRSELNIPQAQMLKDLFNDLFIFNERDDPHPSLAFRASQGVNLIDFLDQSGPVLSILL